MTFYYLDTEMEQWRAGLLLALAVHAAVLILAVFGPDLMESRKKQEQIYTVKLFEPVKQPVKQTSAPAPAPVPKPAPVISRPKPASPTGQPGKAPAVTRPPARKAAPVKKTEQRPAVKKAVSLNPEKKKPVKTTEARPRVREKKSETVGPSREEVLRKRLTAIEQRVKEKAEEKRLQERLSALSQKVRQKKESTARPSGHAGNTSVSGMGTAENINEVIARYGMEVSRRIWRRWNLPTRLIEQKGLEAIIEIRIADNGKIVAHRFEKTSGNMLFDQSAMRAVKDVATVPPLPPQLLPGPLVMGIRFRPDSL